MSVCLCPCINYPGMQSASFPRNIILSCGLINFLIIPQTADFQEKVIELKMCDLIFSTTFV